MYGNFVLYIPLDSPILVEGATSAYGVVKRDGIFFQKGKLC